jgi:hemerythrin-like domain-containing protein
MSSSDQPSLARQLIIIHAAITRALEVAISRSRSFAQQGLPDASVRSGFISYLRSFVSVLNAHHLTEDEVIFPYFREQMWEAPFDLLVAQHHAMVRLLDEMKVEIDEAESRPQTIEPFSSIACVAAELAETWHPHIVNEETVFSAERIDARVAPDEQLRLGRLATEHGMAHSGPDYLVVPFILYNLSPEQRATLTDEMPPIVTQQLVPIAWKAQWEPMSPFLLE